MKRLFRDYRQEIIVASLAVAALVLVMNRHAIEQWQRGAPSVLNKLAAVNAQVGTAVRAGLEALGVWGLVGIGVAVAALGYLVWRIRYRWQKSTRLVAGVCPRCGGGLHRVPRRAVERALSATLLPHARRYRCANEACGWEGLRRRGYQPELLHNTNQL